MFCTSSYLAQTTITYTYTGFPQTFTVPACVSTISLTAKGARGGSNTQGVLGGFGGTAFGVLSVNPGDVLNIYVGGSNGYNGGGLAGFSPCTAAMGGVGGGSSDVRLNGNSLANRVIVGGGGGGAGGNRIVSCGRGTGGGGGGGYYGGGGGAGAPGIGGYVLSTGGSQTAGGIAGTSGLCICNNGTMGALWTGGAGGTEVLSNQGISFSAFSGGDGGGLNGGPGQYSLTGITPESGNHNGCGSSGAGGSSYIGSLLSAYTTSGNVSGNGEVIISYTTSIGTLPLNLSQAYMCVGGSATLNAPSQVSYTWSNGSNASNIIVSPTVNTTYSVTGTNSLGCISLGVITVTVNSDTPTVTINSSSNTVCQGNSVTLSGNGANSYTWSGGINNGNPFIPSSTLTYTLIGTNGCGTSTALVTVSVNPNPTLSLNPTSVTLCAGNSTTLTASGAISYTWTGGIQNGSSFIPSATNIYSVSGSDAFGCIGTATATVNVLPSPSLSPVPSSTLLCIGETCSITATGANNYTWMPGGSNASSIIVSPSITSIYSLTQSIGNCVEIKTVSLIVNSLPTITAMASPSIVCYLGNTTLSGTGALAYTWQPFGGTGATVVVSPTVNTIFTLSASDGTCANTTTVSIVTLPGPSLSIAASPTAVCAGNPATLTISGAPIYSWMPIASTGSAIVVNPLSSTSYSATGTNSLGCSSTVTQAIIVLPSPSLSPIPSSSLLCIGETCTISGNGANNYTWMPGGSNATSIIVNPTITSVYSLTQSIGNCVDIKTVSLIVNSLPTITAMASPSIVCSLGNTTLSGTGALAYTWQPYGGVGQTVVVSPTVSTIFTLSASDGTCANSTTLSLFAQPIPTLSIAANPTIVCPGDAATITVNGASIYSWMPTSSNSSVVVVNPVTSASYSVTGTNSLGCSSIASQFILVKSVPVFSISSTNSFICKGSTTTLSALGANSYSWIGGPTNPSWVVNPNSTTTFSVKGIYPNMGCASTQTISVVVFEPQFTITGNTVVCLGGTTTLTANGANSYTWNGNFFFPFIPVSPTVYTVYQVSAASSSNNLVCSSTKTIGVSVNPNPGVSASASKSLVCIGESVTLTAVGATTYTWSNFPPGASVIVTPSGQQNYTVTGTDTNGCSNNAFVFLKTSECTGIQEMGGIKAEILIYPNPNQGAFKIESSSDINLNLVNALGQLIRYIQLSDINNHEETISMLAPGVYFIVGSGNNHWFTQKILVGK